VQLQGESSFLLPLQRPSLEKLLAEEPASHTIAIAYREYGYELKEIVDCLGVHHSTVSRRFRRQEEVP